MAEKIVTKFNDLSKDEVQDLALCLRSKMYKIVSSTPNQNNVPEGIIDVFCQADTYHFILDDSDANFEYFSLIFASGVNLVLVPIGVYGLSLKHQTYFPLQLNSFGRAFIMTSYQDFCSACGLIDSPQSKEKFQSVLAIREHFIRMIFLYYYNLNDQYNSIMAWSARHPDSPTRKIAEAVKFKRMEVGEQKDKSEVYFKNDFDESAFNYLIQCGARWDTVFYQAQAKSLNAPTTQKKSDVSTNNNLFSFYKTLILS